MLPNFLYSLSHTRPELTYEGLQFLSMMLIRLPASGQSILRHPGWSTHLVPIMLTGGIVEEDGNLSLRTRTLAGETLTGILSHTNSADHRRGSISSTISAHREPLSVETMMADNIKLALNVWVLLHFSHFIVCVDSDDSLFQLLTQSLDAIEDQAGWIPQTILLVRVLLLSLLKKINSSTHKR